MNEVVRYVQSLGLSWSGPYPSSAYKMAKIVNLAGDSVLDVGCATGTYVVFCQRLGKQAHGIDLDKERLQEAISTFGPSFTRASAEALPFADKSFNTVMMWDVLEHVADDHRALAEAIRVARKNILASIPKEHSQQIFDAANGLTYKHYIDPEHKRYYTPKRIAGLIDGQGVVLRPLEHWTRIFPASVYKGTGVPRLLCAGIDRLLWWLWGRRSEAFMRNLFVELVIK